MTVSQVSATTRQPDYTEWWSEDGGATSLLVEVDVDGFVRCDVGVLRVLLHKAGFVAGKTEMASQPAAGFLSGTESGEQVKAQALREYADLLDGPMYTMNYSSAIAIKDQIISLLRRDADLMDGSSRPVREGKAGTE